MSYLLSVRLDLSFGGVGVLCMCGLVGFHGCFSEEQWRDLLISPKRVNLA